MSAAATAWVPPKAASANALGAESAARIVAARLVRQDGGEAKQEVHGNGNLEVPLSGAVVGRKETCTLRLDCPTISGEQFRIAWNSQASHFEIEDRSSNGTFLNGKLVGRGRSCRVVEGDMVRLTKRKEAGLVYRFELVRASSQHVVGMDVRSVPRRPSGELTQVPAPLDEDQEVEERHLLAGLRRRISQEELRASTLTAEVARAKKELAACRSTHSAGNLPGVSSRLPGQTPSKDGLRAAEEEALQEAQRCRLMSQRTVLEAELVEKQASHEQSELQLKRAQALLSKERDERTRLQEELRLTIERYAGVSGDIEAFQEHLVDLERIRCGVVHSIEQARALEGGLEAQLERARGEHSHARIAEDAAQKKTDKLEDAMLRVTEIATALASDMRSQAQQLSARIAATSPNLTSNTDSIPPTMVTAPREVEHDGRIIASPAVQRVPPSWSSNSPAPTTQAANMTDGLKAEFVGRLTLSPDDALQRSPLLDANGKENVSPRLRKRRRLSGSEPLCVAADSDIPEFVRTTREWSPSTAHAQKAAVGGIHAGQGGAKKRRQVTNAEVVDVGRSRLLPNNIEDLCSPER